MFESRKPFVVVLTAAVLASGVAACGDDDESGGAAQSAATATDSAAQTDTSPVADEQHVKPKKAPGGGQVSSGDAESGGFSSSSGSEPTGKVYGDGSIQRYGDPADGGDRDAAVAAAQEFYAARGASDWNRVCELMAGPIVEQLEQLTAKAPQLKGKDCPELLEAMMGAVPAEARRRDAAGLEFGELRVDGDSAFLIFKSTAIPNGYLPMAREDGDWKVAALAGSSLE